jgi:hypothetical protein
MYGFNAETLRLIYVLSNPCYLYLKNNDIAGWNYFFNLFTEPGIYYE